MAKSKPKGGGTYNRFSALEALDEVFELQPGIFASGGKGSSSLEGLLPESSNNSVSFFPPGSFLQNSASNHSSSSSSSSSSTEPSSTNAFSDMVSALPSLGGDLDLGGSGASSWNFGTLASGLSISAAESEEKAAAEAQKKAELAAANIAMSAAVHSGREREEFRSRLLKGRLDISTNVRRRKLTKLKSAESYDDRIKARFGGRGGAMPVRGLFKKGKRRVGKGGGGGGGGGGKIVKGGGKKR
jgi:hypothetical protein